MHKRLDPSGKSIILFDTPSTCLKCQMYRRANRRNAEIGLPTGICGVTGKVIDAELLAYNNKIDKDCPRVELPGRFQEDTRLDVDPLFSAGWDHYLDEVLKNAEKPNS